MSKYFYVRKFVRDDGAQLNIDQKELYLAEENTLLNRPEPRTSFEDYTEADGGEMIRQQLPSFPQEIKGLIVVKDTDYWTLRNRLTNFFQINHTFYIVYEKISGESFTQGEKFKTAGAWIEESIQVPPEPREDYSYWNVTLRIGNPQYQEYAEDESGKEIFANIVKVLLVTSATGGEEWDEYGLVWDTVGSVWESGEGGIQNVAVQSAAPVYPEWTVTGEAVNPEIRNDTNDTSATYTGTVAPGQTLKVDFESGTATLDGINVSRNLSGSFRLEPGENLIAFDIESGDIESSTISWNNILS